jgi:hypothetical protein
MLVTLKIILKHFEIEGDSMNCLKTVNINKDYGLQRIIIFSILISFSYFVLFYVSFSLLFPNAHLKTSQLWHLVSGLLLVFPIHKVLHCLPIWLSGKKASLQVRLEVNNFPMLYCKLPSVLPRNVSLITAALPTILVTFGSIIGSLVYPEYIYVFAIYSSLNIALSTIDVIYFVHLWKAPRCAFLEDNPKIFHILTKVSS